MKRVLFMVAAMLAFGAASAARAQGRVVGPYAEFQPGLTAGSTVSGAFGGEAGISTTKFDLYIEAGNMLNTKSSGMDNAAATILGAIPGGTVEAKQPTNYFAIGGWYKVPTTGMIQPYAGIGVGSAGVTRETKFFDSKGQDITGQLPQMGITLGGDLQGSERGLLFTVGGGARIGLGRRLFARQLFADVSYRYGHVSLEDEGVNTNRILFGIGVHF